ncbi:iron-containing alcohol dehydrogenase [Lachnospiraceae bacterium KGMB03038]|nr:iron-containing alcohol dehydrogenase [Lachnospiraceae bacterium KGMB03038]
MEGFKQLYMPKIICGRGSCSFLPTLGRKRIGVLGYDESVLSRIREVFQGQEAQIRYLATIDHEPEIRDIFDNLEKVCQFQPDLILAVGGGSVLDVAKGIHLFYENPELTFEDSLRPYSLPPLGSKALLAAVPTTSGTGSETSSAAVFVEPKTRVKKLMLSNTLIPHYAVIDADLTDGLPRSVQIAGGLDALCHAVEASIAKNSNVFTKALALEAALDILENLPAAVDPNMEEETRKKAREKLHVAATMAGIAITNSCTGIVHSYDHPGPAFGLAHGITCGIMLSHAMRITGPLPEYAVLARRLGYVGDEESLFKQLFVHIQKMNAALGIPNSFEAAGVDEEEYFERVPEWARISLSAFATQMSPIDMDEKKGERFYQYCYYREFSPL